MPTRRSLLLAGFAAAVSPVALFSADPPAGPAYQIVLRSRTAVATPNRTKDAQTGGGSISVEQPDPNTIVVTMRDAEGRRYDSVMMVRDCAA